jgi:hypothetical protein
MGLRGVGAGVGGAGAGGGVGGATHELSLQPEV